jgi:RNA polymerase sigma factor, sigma-70 family
MEGLLLERGVQVTNEELVQAVKRGEAGSLYTLWAQVSSLVKWWAKRYLRGAKYCGFDDLYQLGYPAMVAAVETFNGAGSFATWLHYHFQNEVWCLMGWCSVKDRQTGETKVLVRDMMWQAQSLDAPVQDEGDRSTARVDLVVDPASCIGDYEESLYRVQLHAQLLHMISELPAAESSVIHLLYFRGLTVQQAAQEMQLPEARIRALEISGLRHLRGQKKNIQDLRLFQCA